MFIIFQLVKLKTIPAVKLAVAWTEKTIKSLKKADGLVVGSAICKEITNSLKKRQNPVTNVYNVVNRLRNKIKWIG